MVLKYYSINFNFWELFCRSIVSFDSPYWECKLKVVQNWYLVVINCTSSSDVKSGFMVCWLFRSDFFPLQWRLICSKGLDFRWTLNRKTKLCKNKWDCSNDENQAFELFMLSLIKLSMIFVICSLVLNKSNITFSFSTVISKVQKITSTSLIHYIADNDLHLLSV